MSSFGRVAVAICVGAFLGYRRFALRRTAGFSLRSEAGYVAIGVAMVVVSIVVTIAERIAMLVLSPLILIPSGVYLVRRPDAVANAFGLIVRRLGWTTLASGLLAGLVAATSLMVRS